MLLRRLSVLILLAAGCQMNGPTGQSSLDVTVPPILDQDHIPSAVIVTGDVDRITYARAFGDATLDTLFDLASCTKVVATTTAVMKLVEEGKLSLDEPIGKYLKPFAGRRITIRECLHHCSGLPAYLTPKSKTCDGILAEIAALKPAGPGYTYSCLNMLSMARVVEEITKMPLAEYVRVTFFEPLGMKDTTFFPSAARSSPTRPTTASSTA